MLGIKKLFRRSHSNKKVHPQAIIDYIKSDIASSSSSEPGVTSSASICTAAFIKMLDIHLPKSEADFKSMNLDVKKGINKKYQGQITKNLTYLKNVINELMKQDINENIDVNAVSRSAAVSIEMINRVKKMIDNKDFSQFIRNIGGIKGLSTVASNKMLVVLAKTVAVKMKQDPEYVMKSIKIYLEYLAKRLDYAIYYTSEVYVAPRDRERSSSPELVINRTSGGRAPTEEEKMAARSSRRTSLPRQDSSYNVRVNKKRLSESKKK